MPATEDLSNTSSAAAAQPRTQAERAPLVTARDLLLLFYLYPAQFFLKYLPRDVLYRMGRVCEPLLQFHYRSWRKKVETRMLQLAANITPEQAPRYARELVRGSIFRLLDDVVINRPSFLKETNCTEHSGVEYLDAAKSAGKGVLLLTCHFYPNRLARRYLAARGWPMLIVRLYGPSEDLEGRLTGRFLRPRLMNFLRDVIQDEVYAQDPGCTLKVLQRLRSGGLVMITPDGRHGARTVQSQLLGVPRQFSSGLLDIVRLSGCAVVPMLCFGCSSNLRIVFSPALDIVKTSTRDEFVSANLPLFIRVLEQQIRGNPAQWTLWAGI
ncbi:MAG TPA: lysophospholipid acyltransferase family protein [Bryobacteraceae bacterium]|nr:lysophospholipid acyltransferase family protein [Bryobacteraceae bacterium]